MAQEQIKPYSDLMLEQIMLHFCSLPKNRNIHEVLGKLTVSDTVDGYNIFLVNTEQMRCFKA
ncbi:hypothetical protein ACFLVV_01405 [Chloroflexota bacterium]